MIHVAIVLSFPDLEKITLLFIFRSGLTYIMVASLILHSSLLNFRKHFSQLAHIKCTVSFKETSYSSTEALYIEIADGYLNGKVLPTGLKQRPALVH